MVDLVVISHFYNEEFLLPFWLDHHRRIFDHGILIDYQSTDKSIDIINDLVPDWEIRSSRNKMFSAIDCDSEVMDIESEFSGWKIALNITEFILHPALKKYCEDYEDFYKEKSVGFKMMGIDMIDKYEDKDREISMEVPLITQCHTGQANLAGPRNRFIHHASHGSYLWGRHFTQHQGYIPISSQVACLWYGWSPFRYIKERKLQIQTKIPQWDKERGLGSEHILTPESLEEKFIQESSRAEDIFNNFYLKMLFRATSLSLYGLDIV
jgi:hypothetical protein